MRWLQTQNRIEEMAGILSKIAKSNGKTLPSSVKDALIIKDQTTEAVITGPLLGFVRPGAKNHCEVLLVLTLYLNI
jgi:hypothetical protein